MKLDTTYQIVLELIKASLWGYPAPSFVNQDVYEEMKKHTLETLPAPILNALNMPPELRKEWKLVIYERIAHNVNCRRAQQMLLISSPYAILKGTEAAKYYPEPKYRILGDIDVITSHEDYKKSLQQLIDGGYELNWEEEREVALQKDGITVELHRSFSILNDRERAMQFDNIIINSICTEHCLPDDINGLVLLEHINHHLVDCIGLRHIIDWMLFVDKYLTDEKWIDFQKKVNNIGLEKLAITTTHMCEIYLGLPRRKWYSEADKTLCDQLMVYILESGNFGNKRSTGRDISENVFVIAHNPIEAFRLLQKRGEYNWKTLQKQSILRPFAWIYQLGRYFNRGLNQSDAVNEIAMAYTESRKRLELLNSLGVRTRI